MESRPFRKMMGKIQFEAGEVEFLRIVADFYNVSKVSLKMAVRKHSCNFHMRQRGDRIGILGKMVPADIVSEAADR